MSAERSYLSAGVLALLLVASAARATEPLKPPFSSYLPSGPEGLVEGSERGRLTWEDWRRVAGRLTEALWRNPELRRRVGEPLDVAGVRCILWKRVAELADSWHGLLVRRYGYWKEQPPSWIRGVPERTRAKAEQACSDKDDGEGGQRPENLGLRYLREHEELQRVDEAARRESAALDADALRILLGLVDSMKALGSAVRGGVAPAGLGLPLANPCLVQPSLCEKEEVRHEL
ncbi:hypothetical protein [Archangium sp.]|uniref:hypothetical protein n=1 Tax=Archangium sp. TaxID=1872627 RepID=UPI00286ABE58|nr:hypothetical protein [Archangium sp.]